MRTVADATVTAPLTRTEFPGGTSYLIGNYASKRAAISPSAIIKGDKVHCYPWSYVIRNKQFLKGVAWGAQGSFGGTQRPLSDKFSGNLQGMRDIDHTGVSQPTIAYNKALDQLNDRVRGGLDLSVAMAECSATFRMVRALTKAERYFSGIGSKRWANEWLELQYGWMPLLSDVYGAAEEIQRVNLGLMRFKGRGSNAVATSKTLSSGGAVDISGISHYTEGSNNVYTDFKINAYNACLIEVWLKPPTTLQELSRWTSLNPLSIAWELTPYSFVFDWFFDVGSYLRNVETSLTYNSAFLTGYRSELYVGEIKSKVRYRDGVDNYFYRVKTIDADGQDTLKTFSRTILGSYPLPRIPHVNTDLSAKRLLSAASLLRQLLK